MFCTCTGGSRIGVMSDLKSKDRTEVKKSRISEISRPTYYTM